METSNLIMIQLMPTISEAYRISAQISTTMKPSSLEAIVRAQEMSRMDKAVEYTSKK